MLLTPQDADLFFRLHRSLMCFVNERLRIIPDVDTPEQFSCCCLKHGSKCEKPCSTKWA